MAFKGKIKHEGEEFRGGCKYSRMLLVGEFTCSSWMLSLSAMIWDECVEEWVEEEEWGDDEQLNKSIEMVPRLPFTKRWELASRNQTLIRIKNNKYYKHKDKNVRIIKINRWF